MTLIGRFPGWSLRVFHPPYPMATSEVTGQASNTAPDKGPGTGQAMDHRTGQAMATNTRTKSADHQVGQQRQQGNGPAVDGSGKGARAPGQQRSRTALQFGGTFWAVYVHFASATVFLRGDSGDTGDTA